MLKICLVYGKSDPLYDYNLMLINKKHIYRKPRSQSNIARVIDPKGK